MDKEINDLLDEMYVDVGLRLTGRSVTSENVQWSAEVDHAVELHVYGRVVLHAPVLLNGSI